MVTGVGVVDLIVTELAVIEVTPKGLLLRELAAGVHPSILTKRGLPAAINALARRSPLPVSVWAATPERLPEGVEANATRMTESAGPRWRPPALV